MTALYALAVPALVATVRGIQALIDGAHSRNQQETS